MGGKQQQQQAQGKLMIAKDKLCDEDFDQLVIDTSRRVTQKRRLEVEASANSRSLQQAATATKTESSDANISVNNEVSNQIMSHATSQGNISSSRSIQPKRPMNAFMVWGQAIRRELHHRFSNVQNALLSKALGRVWRSLDQTEKEPYISEANLIKANHKRDYPNYRYQPRRVQERQARSSTLIGINLNHPVSQHPRQHQPPPSSVDFGLDNQIFARASQAAQSILEIRHHHHHHHQRQYGQSTSQSRQGKQFESDHHLSRSITRTMAQEEILAHVDGAKEIDSVQAFQYQPYPTSQTDSLLQGGLTQRTVISNTHDNEYQHEFINHNHNHHHHQQQQHQQRQTAGTTTVKQAAEYANSHIGSYHRHHQFTYSAHQQYQQAQQPISYEVQQASFLETCYSPAINSRSYYSTIMNNADHQVYKHDETARNTNSRHHNQPPSISRPSEINDNQHLEFRNQVT